MTMRQPGSRWTLVALTSALLSSVLLVAGCASAPTGSPSSAVLPESASASAAASTSVPLPNVSLGAQGTRTVRVILYLENVADVPQVVDVTVAFRAGSKTFTKGKVSVALQPNQHASVMVVPDYSGDVPPGYTSRIVAVRPSTADPATLASLAAAPAVEGQAEPDAGLSSAAAPTSGTEPSGEAVPSGQASDRTSAEAPTGVQIESSGDYVCHAGIDVLPKLRPGSDQTSDVEALQVVLDQLGYPPGPFDGQFGPRTTAAVKGFQSDFGLTVDGLVGPQTWAALVNAYC
jgi:hypothetical protein